MTTFSMDGLPPADPLAQRLCETFLRNRWDFISAQIGDINPFKMNWKNQRIPQKPEWRTERRYPLKSRVLYSRWLSLSEVLGVRFTNVTAYGLIDIDVESQYHPSKNPNALAELKIALETIGIVRTVLVRSSASDGLHLYLPLSADVGTYDLAVSIKFCLESAGYEVRDGQLEIFPNDKAYGVATKILYKGHRLPLQPESGSYLLNEDLQPGSANLADFFAEWDMASAGQDMSFLKKAMSVARLNSLKKPRRRIRKSEEWQRDLEATLTEGWTGRGQTNHLLKEIGCHAVVFKDLSGDRLAEYIEATAKSLPGYRQWCGHQRQIRTRAKAWATAVEKYYWPMHSRLKSRTTRPGATLNAQRAQAARERITAAVEVLEAEGSLPLRPTARLEAIKQASGGSQETLYRYKELWHPEHRKPIETPVIPVVESTTAISAPPPSPKPNRRKPCQVKELRTSPQIMKCSPARNEVSKKRESPLLLPRGVQGGLKSFPQVKASPNVSNCLPSTTPDGKGHKAEESMTEIIEGIRKQVTRLTWTYKELANFISHRFNGRRRAQLQDSDLISLLYYLQSEQRGSLYSASVDTSNRSMKTETIVVIPT